MNRGHFFESLWNDYVNIAPVAATLKSVFEGMGETVINDHVAFRTFDQAPIDLQSLETHVLSLGYQKLAPYQFEAKKLNAWGYLPPNPGEPRIFLSELQCEKLSERAQTIIQKLCAQINPTRVKEIDVMYAGPLWKPISWNDYQILQEESEYAAWVAALGLRANHFTISVTDLKQTNSVEEVLRVVETQNIPVNESGGRVKGSSEVLLEQGSTMADIMPVLFADNDSHNIPTCYYEFAKRYPDKKGKLYQGFVAASADRIFESTNQKPSK